MIRSLKAKHRLGKLFSQLGYCGGIEKSLYRQIRSEDLYQRCDDPGCAQGVAAQFEKIVIDSQTVDSQDRGPDCRELDLHRRAWRYQWVIEVGSVSRRRGQTKPIGFPVRSLRKRIHDHKR